MDFINLKSLNLTAEESKGLIKFLAEKRGITTKKLLSTIKLNLKRKNNKDLVSKSQQKLIKSIKTQQKLTKQTKSQRELIKSQRKLKNNNKPSLILKKNRNSLYNIDQKINNNNDFIENSNKLDNNTNDDFIENIRDLFSNKLDKKIIIIIMMIL